MVGADRAELLGVQFERGDMDAVAAQCLAWLDGPRTTHIVVTANASHLCMMRRDADLRHACQAADLAVPDGMSVVWALKLLGRPVAERVAGIDLMTRLLADGASRQARVYLLGARPEVVARVAEVCRERWPGLVVAGTRDGYFTAADHAAIVDEIRAAAPQFLFVGMPTPFKDVFCQAHRDRLQVPVVIGVGGSFDVLAGVVSRAPVAVQRLGLEWAWRLAMEPRKLWKRYLTTNTEFVWLVMREWLRGRV